MSFTYHPWFMWWSSDDHWFPLSFNCDRPRSFKWKHVINRYAITIVALAFFRALNDSLLTFLRMHDYCKITNVQRNAQHLWYKYHRLFVNSAVVIILKSCLNFFLNSLKYYVCLNHCHGLSCTRDYDDSIKTCLKICLLLVNLGK